MSKGARVKPVARHPVRAAVLSPLARALVGAFAQSMAFDVILCAGQSNMAGRGTYSAGIDTESDRVWQYGCASGDPTYRTVVDADYPMLRHEGNLAAGHISLAHSFAKSYAARTGRRVLLVPVCQGSTTLVYGSPLWAPPSGFLYTTAVAQANLAIAAAQAVHPDSRFAGVIWLQGETDADNSVAAATYSAALDNLIAQFRANITGGANSWFVLGQMVPEATALRGGTWTAIDAVHMDLPNRVLRTATAAGASGNTADNLHYNAAGCRIMGPRFDAAVAVAQANVAFAAPGQATGLTVGTVTSTTVDLSWTAPASGGAPTDYTIEYKPSGGSWTTFVDAVSNSTAATVTGLAGSTAYDFRVTATNGTGSGTPSATASATTAAASAYVRMSMLTGYAESGSGPYTYTETAAATGFSGGSRCGGSNLKMPANSASIVAATCGHTYGTMLGLVTTAGTNPTWNQAAGAGYAYGIYNNSTAYAQVTAQASGAINGTATAPLIGDIVRLRREDNGTTATIYAEVARAATPTTWILLHTWSSASRADLYPCIAGHQSKATGPVTHTGMA